MNAVLKKNLYKAFGMIISSEILLPELTRINIVDHNADIVIEKAELYSIWSEQSKAESNFIIKPNWIMFHISDVGYFSIENGNRIVFSPLREAHEDEIRLYILGSCMGALLLQRGILPLHGSAIAIEGKAYAIVGDSGAGKSTLASAFLKRGYKLLSDDVIPVTLNEENIPMVTPAYPQQKLWLESLNHFEMQSNQYRSLISRADKFAIPVQSMFATESLPLAGIFELVTSTENEEVKIHPIQDLQRFYKLFYHTYRNFFIQESGLMDWHFNISSKMINKISFFQLCRPTTRFTAHDLTDVILNTIKMEEKGHDYERKNYKQSFV
ncbi:aldolase [Bacillus sp. JJ722]|uniref:aldolase n=1 Tax=Bacillus sp. JJ722 TaxID=3122973 RepID=UPI003000EA95